MVFVQREREASHLPRLTGVAGGEAPRIAPPADEGYPLIR